MTGYPYDEKSGWDYRSDGSIDGRSKTISGLGATTMASATVTGALSANSLAATAAVTGASMTLTGAMTASTLTLDAASIDVSGALFCQKSIDTSGALTADTISGTTSISTAALTCSGNEIVVSTAQTINNANDPGTTGTIAWDGNYLYVCVASNTWQRVGTSSW